MVPQPAAAADPYGIPVYSHSGFNSVTGNAPPPSAQPPPTTAPCTSS
ncbi:hypothetical protein [Streptomyces sp. NPDC053542]